VFVLGIFTIVRLIDTGIEFQEALRGIARIRGYYRTLTPEAAIYFSVENGRWPEKRSAPRILSGAFVALLTTAASMIAFTNSVVAGAGVTVLLSNFLGSEWIGLALSLGAAPGLAFMTVFLVYQRGRYRSF
jgi:hypothetical protein